MKNALKNYNLPIDKYNGETDNLLASKQASRDSAIDYIKGIAIIMVFLVHYGQTFGNPMATQFGQMGCQVFIFASGYVCCYSLQRKKSKLDFYKRRFISITPGFYTQLLFVVILNIAFVRIIGRPFVGVGRTDVFSVIVNAFLLHGVIPAANNSVFPGGWFIGSLWLLYLLHPWIYDLYIRAKKPIVIILAGSCLGVLLTFLVNTIIEGDLQVVNNSFEYFLFSNQLCCYLSGMWLFSNIDRLMRIQKGLITIAVVIALGTTVFVFYSNFFARYIIVTPLMGFTSMLGYLLIRKYGFRTKTSKLIVALGRNSFYIYLVHTIAVWPIARALNKMIGMKGIDNQLVALMLLIIPTIAITTVLAFGLKVLVDYEKRLLKL